MSSLKSAYNTATASTQGWMSAIHGISNKIEQKANEAQRKYEERMAEIQDLFYSTGKSQNQDQYDG